MRIWLLILWSIPSNKGNLLIHFHSCFSSRESCRGSRLRWTQNASLSTATPYSSADSTPRRTKQGWRCNHAIWSLVDIWATFSWLQPVGHASPIYLCKFRISRFGGYMTRHSVFYEFHSHEFCREVPNREPLAKIPPLLLALEWCFFSHYLRFMNIGDNRNKDLFISWHFGGVWKRRHLFLITYIEHF